MKKKALMLMAIAWLLANAVSVSATEKPEKSLSFGLGALVGADPGKFSFNPISFVDKFPSEMRFVPIHRYDRYDVSPENNGLIPDGKMKMPFQESIFKFKGGLFSYLRFYRLKLRGEIGIGYSLFSLEDDLYPECERIRERDYLGNPGSSERGEGTALTYYGLICRQPALYHSIELEWDLLDKENYSAFLLGTRKSSYELTIEQGWDRYDRLEKYRTFLLGKFQSRDIYIGVLTEDSDQRISSNSFLRAVLMLGVSLPYQWRETKNQESAEVRLRKIAPFLQVSLVYAIQ